MAISSIAKVKRDGLIIFSGSGPSDRLDIKYETGDLNYTVGHKVVNYFLDRGDFSTDGGAPNLRYGDEQPTTFTFTAYVTEISASDSSATVFDMMDGGGGADGWTSRMGSGHEVFATDMYYICSGSNVGEDKEILKFPYTTVAVSVAEGDPNTLTVNGTSHQAVPTRVHPDDFTE